MPPHESWHSAGAVLLATLAAAVGGTSAAAQQPTPVASRQGIYAELEADSLSVGHADSGRLESPFALRSSDVLVTVRPHKYGTRELVGLLARAAASVARTWPGSRLAVGDLSSEHGGHLSPHESHQSGRDADVGFYVLDDQGQRVPRAIFQQVEGDGSVRRGDRRFVFDDARNWALLTAFVDDPMAETQYVILAPHIRERLLAHARATGASEDQIRRVARVTEPMRGSDGHDNHFHVRIYCSVGDRPQCLDRPPLHPWYYGTPSPDAVAAARVADLMRAAALRRRQRQAGRPVALARGHVHPARSEAQRARDLLLESSRQQRAERRRAAGLSTDERRAVRELRRLEREARRLELQGNAQERGRAAALARDERRWREVERRRATRLRENQRHLEAAQRRLVQAEAREAAKLKRRAEAQAQADRRRVRALLRRSERLGRERERSTRQRLGQSSADHRYSSDTRPEPR